MNVIYENTDLEKLLTYGTDRRIEDVKCKKEFLQSLSGLKSVIRTVSDASELRYYRFLSYTNYPQYSAVTIESTSIKCEIKFRETNNTITFYDYEIMTKSNL